jgi:hypothetical protein
MQVVYKYEIPANKQFILEMPKGAKIITAEARGSGMFLWAMVDRDLPHEEARRFLPVVVGQPIPDDLVLEFIGMLWPENFVTSILLFEIKNG